MPGSSSVAKVYKTNLISTIVDYGESNPITHTSIRLI